MRTNRFLISAALMAVAACSDAPTGPGHKGPLAVPQVPALMELTGDVVPSGTDMAPAYLRTASALIPLLGDEASVIAGVEGATAFVRGTMDADQGLVVASFQVLAVRGRAVADGTLERFDNTYSLRLANGGAQLINNPPAALITHVGARVWIADGDGAPLAFGIIRDNQ